MTTALTVGLNFKLPSWDHNMGHGIWKVRLERTANPVGCRPWPPINPLLPHKKLSSDVDLFGAPTAAPMQLLTANPAMVMATWGVDRDDSSY